MTPEQTIIAQNEKIIKQNDMILAMLYEKGMKVEKPKSVKRNKVIAREYKRMGI